MTQSNKTAQNPAKSRIKSLKSVTHQNATWRKWLNQPGLLARQAVLNGVMIGFLGGLTSPIMSPSHDPDFVSPFLFQLPLLPTRSINLLHQPTINQSQLTRYLICYSIRPILSVPPCSPSPQSVHQSAYQPVIVIAYFVCDFACYYHVIRAFIAPVIV